MVYRFLCYFLGIAGVLSGRLAHSESSELLAHITAQRELLSMTHADMAKGEGTLPVEAMDVKKAPEKVVEKNECAAAADSADITVVAFPIRSPILQSDDEEVP